MHILLVSACEKRAIKRTRALLDSYAPRLGEQTWAAPMTKEGLTALHQALRRSATRQTAVACYQNDGRRQMRLLWTVGARDRFLENGQIAVGSTRNKHLNKPLPAWINQACLIAAAAGDMHDIGKASKRFQHKLRDISAIKKDRIRHEWLSVKLLQALRNNGWNWEQAWLDVADLGDEAMKALTLGKRNLSAQNPPDGLLTADEVVDYLIMTHHGLPRIDSTIDTQTAPPDLVPGSTFHVRGGVKDDGSQLICAGKLSPEIFEHYQHQMRRLQTRMTEQQAVDPLYFKALAIHTRAALIFADHTVSALPRLDAIQPAKSAETLFANTTIIANDTAGQTQRALNQSLDWHLQAVGQRAGRIARLMHDGMRLPGLCPASVEQIIQRTTNRRFLWQNKAASALEKLAERYSDAPALVLNVAATGSGKTRMNLRAACVLAPVNPRLVIAQNLRSLTLQAGSAIRQSVALPERDLAVIIGDPIMKQLHEQHGGNNAGRLSAGTTSSVTDTSNQNELNFDVVDDDENRYEPDFDVAGEAHTLPDWMAPLFSSGKTKSINQRAANILTAPLLISTIDYLIAAGEPDKQGHHVRALLRVISSDLILDEIDSYEPAALTAVLRLVQLSALYGRRVICSSATLAPIVAESLEHAFRSGLLMRASLYGTSQKAIYAIIDDQLSPQVWLTETDKPAQFTEQYRLYLKQLISVIDKRTIVPRLAELQPVPEQGTFIDWCQAIAAAISRLHRRHCWQHLQSGKQVSIGLIRVARVKTAIDLAQWLTNQYPDYRVACYHASDWLLSRYYKEQRLDELLSRGQGDDHLQHDPALTTLLSQATNHDVPLLVIATPVEEIGRDHDFDWGIIDISSAQSLVQTAGRINRHRLQLVKTPNIAILQFNAQHMLSDKSRQQSVFTKPGYEGYRLEGQKPRMRKAAKPVYFTHDLAQLLPWDNQRQLQVDARLRLDLDYCKLASLDEERIKHWLQRFWSEPQSSIQSTKVKTGIFSRQLENGALLGSWPYELSPLRTNEPQDNLFFRLDDDGEPRFFEKVRKENEYGKATTGDADCSDCFSLKHIEKGAWLFLTPKQMDLFANAKAIRMDTSCHVMLRKNEGNRASNEKKWQWDIRFGIRRL